MCIMYVEKGTLYAFRHKISEISISYVCFMLYFCFNLLNAFINIFATHCALYPIIISTNSIRILSYDDIINLNISLFNLSLLSGNSRWEYVSIPTLPKTINDLLNKFNTMPRILRFTERSLWYRCWYSTKKDVVGTQETIIIWVVGNPPNRALIHQIGSLQQACI